VRQVIVHIGLEKAASTSLQASLVAAREKLAAAGVAFPAMGGGGAKDQADLRRAIEGDRDAAAAARRVLADAAHGPADRLLLAGETLYRAGPAPLLALLGETGWEDARVRAVAVVRDPAGWLNSRYAFAAIHFRERGGFAAHAKRALRRGEAAWSRVFAPWLAADRVLLTAVPLRARAQGGSAVARALCAMGLCEVGVTEAPARNTGVDPRTVEAGRRLAVKGLARAGRPARRRANRALRAAAEREGFGGRFVGLDPALAERIAASCAAENDAFARKVWGAPWREVYDVPDPARFVPNEWARVGGPPADEEAIARVVAHVRERGPVVPWWPRRLLPFDRA